MSRCSNCGHVDKGKPYAHSLGTHHVIGLDRLDRAGGRARLSTLGLTRNQIDNFQKLRYFELVTNPKRGVWELTPLARDWLNRAVRVQRRVWSQDGEWLKDDEAGELVYVDDVFPGYAQRPEYAAGTS